MKAEKGFTLVELMIVVAIIAIISAVAYPSYQDSVRKANRADAMDTMLDTAQRMERCYTSYGVYDNATNCPVLTGTLPIESPHKHYEISVATTASTYTLTATPITAQQLADTQCTTFVLDQTGKKTATGTTPTLCW